MILKKKKPLNSSLRHRIIINKKILNLKKFKRLFFLKKNNSGRDKFGRITVRCIGSGKKNLRRKIDFYRIFTTNENNFLAYDIDKKYSSFLALIKHNNGCVNYILAPLDINKKNNIKTSFLNNNNIGDSAPLGWIKSNTIIHNIETKPFSGGKYIRSAGTYGRILFHYDNNVLVRLPTKKKIYLSKYCMATVGRLSNLSNFLLKKSKAGLNRIYNNRPRVNGEAMNPIDHPNGGRTRNGKPPKNYWGKIIK